MQALCRLLLLSVMGWVCLPNGRISPALLACPACVGTTGPQLSLAQHVINCESAVCAIPTADRRRFLVEVAFKGERDPRSEVVLQIAALPQGRIPADQEVLLGYESLSQQWRYLGTIPPGHRKWLAALGQLKRTADLSHEDWLQRTRFFLQTLDDPETLVRETAFRELSRTPYSVMRACRDQLDAESLLRTLAPDQFPERTPLVALFLGIVGGPVADNWLMATRDDELWRREGGARAALLVARLEREGEPGLPRFLAEEILADPLRDRERRAALLALSVQGTADGVIPRSTVVVLYEQVLEQRAELADLIAADLVSWNEAGLITPLQRLLETGRLSPDTGEAVGRALERLRKQSVQSPSS
jgi:hypothetical protein